MAKTKEEIYDEKINPLMAQIVAICKLNKIALLANFQIPSEDDDTLQSTTALLTPEYEPSKEQLVALGVVQDGSRETE